MAHETAVDFRHAGYEAHLTKWLRCRHVNGGQDAVKGQGEIYLPRLESHSSGSDPKYRAYKERALFFNGFKRTVRALSGSVFRKPATVSDAFPQVLTEHLADVTLTGEPVDSFAKNALAELLKVGRLGVLIDFPTDAVGKSLPPEDQRPYWTVYQAESILNWRSARIRGRVVLRLVVLAERASDADRADRFDPKPLDRIRVLELIPDVATDEWMAVFEIWEKRKDEKEWRQTTGPTPLFARGEKIRAIPFCFFSPSGIDIEPEDPPLLDLADVNVSLYQTSADLEHGRHFTSLPQPWVSGVKPKTDAALVIGSGVAWFLPDVGAKAGMLEYKGEGLGALENAEARKIAMMATLGGRMLEQQTKGVEAADTVRMRHSGEHATLRDLALAIDLGFSKLLQWHVGWMGLGIDKPGELTYTTNKDFIATMMPAAELNTLMTALLAGRISLDTWYYNLERGEWAIPGRSLEVELEAIVGDEARLGDGRDQPPDPGASD